MTNHSKLFRTAWAYTKAFRPAGVPARVFFAKAVRMAWAEVKAAPKQATGLSAMPSAGHPPRQSGQRANPLKRKNPRNKSGGQVNREASRLGDVGSEDPLGRGSPREAPKRLKKEGKA